MTQAVTIRLAYRDLKLARLVRADDESEGGKVILQNENLRVREVKDGGAPALRLEELPGKPVKRKLRWRIYNTRNLATWYDSEFLMYNVLKDLKLSASMKYDDAVGEVDRVLESMREKLLNRLRTTGQISQYGMRGDMPGDTKSLISKLSDPRLFSGVFYEKAISFLEVEPADYKPVTFQGVKFGGTCEWDACRWSRDAAPGDAYGESTDFFKTTSPGGARKLFRMFKADPTLASRLTITQFNELLDKYKIGVKYVASVWR